MASVEFFLELAGLGGLDGGGGGGMGMVARELKFRRGAVCEGRAATYRPTYIYGSEEARNGVVSEAPSRPTPTQVYTSQVATERLCAKPCIAISHTQTVRRKQSFVLHIYISPVRWRTRRISVFCVSGKGGGG